MVNIARIALVFFAVGSALAQTPGPSQWGRDDQRGAANRITPAKVLEAMRLVREGKIYSLGRKYEEEMPYYGNRSFRITSTWSSQPVGKNNLTSHSEYIAGELGQVGTQLDGLGHIGVGDLFYNGFDRRDFFTSNGLTKLGIENAGVFISRGLLLDIAALKGVARLEKGYEISEADLVQSLKKQNLEMRGGDVVLIHTGWGSLWGVDNKLFASGKPGLSKSAARYLVSKQISLFGTDAWGAEAVPHPDPEEVHPVHQILIPLGGIYIVENVDTSALARDKAYEFAFILAPLPLKGASGSPCNPVALK